MPASLFKDWLMRKPDKAALRRLLSKEASVTKDSRYHTHVLDGGVAMFVGQKWEHMLRFFVYTCTTSPSTTPRDTVIVFDAYSKVPSTKDQEHQQRFTTMAATIKIAADAPAHRNQTTFFANSANKGDAIPSVNACKQVAVQCTKQLVMQIL